jgi:hypothetical protein
MHAAAITECWEVCRMPGFGPGAKAARVTLDLAPNGNRSEVALSNSSAIDKTDVI